MQVVDDSPCRGAILCYKFIFISTLKGLVTLISPGGAVHVVELLGGPRLPVRYDILYGFNARNHFDLGVGDRQSRDQCLHPEVFIIFGLLQALLAVS